MSYARPDVPSKCTWQKDADPSTSPHSSVSYVTNNEQKILPNILHAVGNTPLVKLNRIPKSEGVQCELLVKCEFMNPGGSVKDRIAVRMIEDAERKGLIEPGYTLLETTAGNTGIGLAMVAAVKGYRCKILMSTKYSTNKNDILKTLGAEIIPVPAETNKMGTSGSQFEICKRLQATTPNSYTVGQFTNESNALAHYDLTALEILDQCDGKIDMVVLGAGTGGTMSGIGRRFKELCPNCVTVGVDVSGSALSQPNKQRLQNEAESLIEGIGFPIVPAVIDRSVVDFWVKVSDASAFAMAKRLHKEEGLLCGGSSGAVLVAALKAAVKLKKHQRCVLILPDGVCNYMNGFINDQWLESRNLKPCVNINNHWWWNKEVTALSVKNVVTIQEGATCKEALKIMNERCCEYIPVVSTKMSLMGIVTPSNLMNLLLNCRIEKDSSVIKAISKDFRICNKRTKLGLVSRMLEIEPFVLVVSTTQEAGTNMITAADIFGLVTKMNLLQFIADCRNKGSLVNNSCNGLIASP